MKIKVNSAAWTFLPVVLLALLVAPASLVAGHQHDIGAPAATERQHDAAPPAEKPSAQTEHAHPAQAPAPGVGLDEHLGARIPLEITFRDEDGRPVRLRDLVTRPTVIAPVYFRCPNVCHFLQGELAQVLPQLQLAAGRDYRVLSISFDETETPEIARRSRDTYLAAANDRIPADGWRFLTGEAEAIRALTDAAGFRFQRAGSEFQHPVAILVVSTDGTIVRYLYGTSILPKDLALALLEAREGHVGTTIRKMVQFCFSYDPAQKTYVFNLLRVAATAILGTLAVFFAGLLLAGRKKSKDRPS